MSKLKTEIEQQKEFFNLNNNMEKTVKQRIVEIANEIRISKDGRNDFAKYNYFQPDSILALLNPLLLKYNLHINFSLEQVNEHYKAILIISDFNSTESEKYIFDIDKAIVKGANASQNSGATLTYAKRYSLMNAFNIADNTADFDSNEMTEKNKKAELDKARQELSECESLDSLKTVYLMQTKEVQKELKDFKDNLKAELIKKEGVDSILGKDKK